MGNLVGATPPFGSAHPLVGREREQRLLREALASALGGRGGLVLLAGEAGIGKTALARDLAREAHARSATVLLGRAYDLSEPPPYGVWLDLLGSSPPGDQPDPLGEPRAALRPAAGQAGGGQLALFERAFAGFAHLAGRRPLVCVLDDLHWADHASLDLLRFAARQLAKYPLLLVGTYRADEVAEQHPLLKLLPALVREAEPLRIALPPLEAASIRQLVRADYPLAPEAETRLLAYLQERAAGNPLYLGELLRTLEEDRLLRISDGERWVLADLAGVQVPPLLRQVIAERLERLGVDATRWLAVAAVIGQVVPLTIWAAIAGVPEDELLALAERASAARVLDAMTDGLRVQFHHPLIRQALYDGLSPLRRRAVHQQLGDHLVALPQPDPDTVADHLLRAGDSRAVEWLLRASDRARRAYARFAAADRLAAAIALLDQRGADPAERGWLCDQLAGMLTHIDRQRALPYAERALALAIECGDRALAAHAQSALGMLRCRDGHLRAGLLTLEVAVEIRESFSPDDQERFAARRAALGDTAPAHVFRGAFANWLTIAGRYDEAQALAAPLIPANGVPRESGYSITCFALAMVATNRGRVDEGIRWFAEARAIARALDELFLIGQYALLQILYVHLPYRVDQPGEGEQLAAAAAEGYQLAAGAVRADAPPGLARLPLLVLAGEWNAAWEVAQAVRSSDGLNATNGQAALGPLALARGETVLAWELVRDVLSDGPATEPGDCVFRTGVTLLRVAAHLALDACDLDTARAWLGAHERWLAWNGAVPGRAEGQLGWATYHRAAGDLAAAREAAECALAHASEPRQPLALLAAHRMLGELAAEARHHADAQAHIDAALALADACAAPYERALTLLALAELRSKLGRVTEAQTVLAEARATFARLGASPALASADRLLARLALVRAVSDYPDGLTEREVAVLRLAAAGRSNREIAAALAVSERTVERHLENTYRKIGARNRADAVAYAVRHNLT